MKHVLEEPLVKKFTQKMKNDITQAIFIKIFSKKLLPNPVPKVAWVASLWFYFENYLIASSLNTFFHLFCDRPPSSLYPCTPLIKIVPELKTVADLKNGSWSKNSC